LEGKPGKQGRGNAGREKGNSVAVKLGSKAGRELKKKAGSQAM
jgi:hypothetical protein